MKLDIYQIDAFTNRVFGGNPAAVVPLKTWLSDDTMQAIARENNLSETAFFVASAGRFEIRWFTPVAEVDLCGHATLATAYVIFNEMKVSADSISFSSRSGPLSVFKRGEQLVLDFPSQPPALCPAPTPLREAFDLEISSCYYSEDYLIELNSVEEVKAAKPDANKLCELDLRGVIITAQDGDNGFVSRCFFPKLGIYEDPVTGSAHTQLTPYWAQKLNVTELCARQMSQREGILYCSLHSDRVQIAGQAVKYMSGSVFI